jgi:hypothetical protein
MFRCIALFLVSAMLAWTAAAQAPAPAPAMDAQAAYTNSLGGVAAPSDDPKRRAELRTTLKTQPLNTSDAQTEERRLSSAERALLRQQLQTQTQSADLSRKPRE